MNVRRRCSFVAWTGLLLSFALLGGGCGDDSGLTKRYSVSGKVTYKGEPVKKATITFLPTTPDGRGAGGQVVDGQYTLTTSSPNDGALPGMYKVTIDDRQTDTAKAQAEVDALAKKRGVTYSRIPEGFQGRAKNLIKGVVPGKYQTPETSGLEKEVKAQSNTIDFVLTD